jgi:hypothetical protein
MRRWQLDGDGTMRHQLFRQVRYHDADIIEFVQRSAQHLMTTLVITREFKPAEQDATLAKDLVPKTSRPGKSPRLSRYRSTFPRSGRMQCQACAVSDAAREPAVFVARDPDMGDCQQCARERRCKRRREDRECGRPFWGLPAAGAKSSGSQTHRGSIPRSSLNSCPCAFRIPTATVACGQ